MTVPLVDLSWQYRQIQGEVAQGWQPVLESTAFVQGPDVTLFEDEFAAYCRTSACVGVANGTDALEIALRAAGVTAGQAVALPANTFVATASAVRRCGAVPRPVDVSPDTMLLDPEKLDVRGCSAVIPVHLYGQMAPMQSVLEVSGSVPVIEDAAQSQGAKQAGRSMGAWGLAAATSFYPGKNLGAFGDAGAVLSSRTDFAERMRLIANHGSSERYRHETFGFNSRLDTLQAVVLRAKLRRLDSWNQLRGAAAQRYQELLAPDDRIVLPVTAPGNEHVWHLYTVRVPGRDDVLLRLQAAGVQAAVHYPTPIHLHEAFSDLGLGPGSFPVAEAAARGLLTLPLYPGITASQQEQVAEALQAALL